MKQKERRYYTPKGFWLNASADKKASVFATHGKKRKITQGLLNPCDICKERIVKHTEVYDLQNRNHYAHANCVAINLPPEDRKIMKEDKHPATTGKRLSRLEDRINDIHGDVKKLLQIWTMGE